MSDRDIDFVALERVVRSNPPAWLIEPAHPSGTAPTRVAARPIVTWLALDQFPPQFLC